MLFLTLYILSLQNSNPNCPVFFFQHYLGMSTIPKEVTGPTAMGKHSLLSDPRIESPPKRPKSSEGKTSANEQVSFCSVTKKGGKRNFGAFSRLTFQRKCIFWFGNFCAHLNKLRQVPPCTNKT